MWGVDQDRRRGRVPGPAPTGSGGLGGPGARALRGQREGRDAGHHAAQAARRPGVPDHLHAHAPLERVGARRAALGVQRDGDRGDGGRAGHAQGQGGADRTGPEGVFVVVDAEGPGALARRGAGDAVVLGAGALAVVAVAVAVPRAPEHHGLAWPQHVQVDVGVFVPGQRRLQSASRPCPCRIPWTSRWDRAGGRGG